MPEKNPAMRMNPREIFQTLLGQLNHEDELLAYRTGWLLSTQFALLVGYFTIDKAKLPEILGGIYRRMICLIGGLTTIFIFASMLASLIVFVELRGKIHQLAKQWPDLCIEQAMRNLPKVGIGFGLLGPIVLSVIILIVWVLLVAWS
jgi:hypothetical protein